MKTKTGQFLMQQNKTKAHNLNSTSQSKPQQKDIATPKREKKNLFSQQSKEKIKNKQGQKSIQKSKSYEQSKDRQILELRNQNKVLSQQIERLKKQCTQLKISVQEKSQIIQKNALTQQKQNIESTKTSLGNRNSIELIEQAYQKQISIIQQKARNLQVQNYRLIESNYLLLIRLRKNMKQYKQSLLRIGNMLQNLQFSEASRQLYGILGRMKSEQGWVDGQIGQIKKINNNNEQDKEKEMQEYYLKKRTLQKQISLKKLIFISGVCHESHFPPSPSLMQLENSIQVNLRRVSSPPIHHPSNSFQLISQLQPKSVSQFPSKKLFNSEIHQPDFMEKSPSAKQFTDWQNGQGNGSIVKRTVYKCHGNSTQLYKLLFLQASAIQSFFA